VKSAPFYGWVVVGTAFAMLLMAYGAQFAFGIFFTALLEEFGWSRAGLSGAFALSLGAGFIYDRTGSYDLAWWLAAAFNVVALALLGFVRPPRGSSLIGLEPVFKEA